MKSSLLSIVEKVTLLFGYPLAIPRFWNQKVTSCPWHSVSDKVTYQTDGDIFDGQFVTIRFPPLPPTSSQNFKLTLVADTLASLFRFGKGGLWTTEKFSCHSSSNDEHHCPYTFNQNDPSNRCRINRKRAVNQTLILKKTFVEQRLRINISFGFLIYEVKSSAETVGILSQ